MGSIILQNTKSNLLFFADSFTSRQEKVLYTVITLLLLIIGIVSIICCSYGVLAVGVEIGITFFALAILSTVVMGVVIKARKRKLEKHGDVSSYLKCRNLWKQIGRNKEEDPLVKLGKDYALWEFCELSKRTNGCPRILSMESSFLVYFYFSYRLQNSPYNFSYHSKRLLANYSILSYGIQHCDALLNEAQKKEGDAASSVADLLVTPHPMTSLLMLRGAAQEFAINYHNMRTLLEESSKLLGLLNYDYEEVIQRLKKVLRNDLDLILKSNTPLAKIWRAIIECLKISEQDLLHIEAFFSQRGSQHLPSLARSSTASLGPELPAE